MHIFKILAASEPLESFPFPTFIANNDDFWTECHISFYFYKSNRHNPTMGRLVVAGLQELRTLFGTYEQFISCFCNVYFL